MLTVSAIERLWLQFQWYTALRCPRHRPRRSVNGRDYAAVVNVPVILIFITILCLVHCFNIVARPTCAFMDSGVRACPGSVVALGKTLHLPPLPTMWRTHV